MAGKLHHAVVKFDRLLLLSDCVVLTGMHLWQAKYAPFMRTAQTHFCTRLIVVPLTTFHRLSEQIGDPQGEVIFLFNTARCGSTLLTQVKTSSSDNITILTKNKMPRNRRDNRPIYECPENCM